MTPPKLTTKPSIQTVATRIVMLRNQRVMLDTDLAELYEVQTKVLVQAVKRNLERFPADFMFQLENQDLAVLSPQIVTSSPTHGVVAPRRMPSPSKVSSVLNSPRAIAVSINVIWQCVCRQVQRGESTADQ